MRDSSGQAGAEIEVTPAMRIAGAAALDRVRGAFGEEETVEAVYIAMVRCRFDELRQQSPN